MMFLFDDWANQSRLHNCKDWEAAESFAKDNALTLVGEFVGWYDGEKGEWEYVT